MRRAIQWIALGTILLNALFTLIVFSDFFIEPIAVLFPILSAVAGITLAVLNRYDLVPREGGRRRRGKRKRKDTATATDPLDDKVHLLMDIMEEDERAAFKQALQERILDRVGRLEDDGELPYAFEYDEEHAVNHRRR
jgi:hypothetical protein